MKATRDNMNCQNNWAEMTDEELAIAAYGEGIPPESPENEYPKPAVIDVSLSSENTTMPFGIVINGPYLALFWPKTGAHCCEEQEY